MFENEKFILLNEICKCFISNYIIIQQQQQHSSLGMSLIQIQYLQNFNLNE